ncbi:MAG: hypothetical protein JW763_08000 [candidate division Zixibacteria bacterium]|nr:hypothetical protein [candidate division Zixibacteria bacterium]
MLVSLAFCLPFFRKWEYIGVGDWELFCTMAAVPAKTITYFGQFPFWNPYLGGGNILFAHPEVGIASPFFLLIMLFGPVAGLKVQILLAYFLGFYGTYLLARKIGLGNLASYLVSFTYYGSSYFALHFSIGHIPFTHFCFLPWVILFLLKAEGDWKYILGAAGALALIILGNGAAVPLLYTLFFCGMLMVLLSIEQGHLRHVRRFLVATVLGVLLAGVKFFPMYSYLSQNRWEGMPTDQVPLSLAFTGLFSFDQWIFRTAGSGQYWGWHEYGAYLSPAVLILAVVGAVCCLRRSRLWLILGLFFFIFGLGHFSPVSLWNLIVHLPGFSSVRSPARAFQFVVLAFAIMAGFGLDFCLNRLKTTFTQARYLAVVLVAAVIVVNLFINLPSLRTIGYKKPEPVVFQDEFRQEIGRKDDIYNQFRRNRGSLVTPWLSGYKESRGMVTPTSDVLMEYVVEGRAQVLYRRYTPNRVEYAIRSDRPGTIVFGIGYDEGWYAEDGRRLFERNALVAMRFTAQDHEVVLKYRTPYFYLGLVISLLTLAVCLLLWRRPQLGNRCKAIFE